MLHERYTLLIIFKVTHEAPAGASVAEASESVSRPVRVNDFHLLFAPHHNGYDISFSTQEYFFYTYVLIFYPVYLTEIETNSLPDISDIFFSI